MPQSIISEINGGIPVRAWCVF